MNIQFETKAIVFDLMGVLLFKRKDYVSERMIDSIDKLIGETVDDLSLKREISNRYGLAEGDIEKALEKCANKYERLDPLWKILPELRKKYKLAIINNGTALTLDYLNRKYSIRDNFDLFISSALEGVRKPNSEIFIVAAERLGVKPGECLFMDDIEENIKGARNVGMKTIWWEDREFGLKKFREFLEERS